MICGHARAQCAQQTFGAQNDVVLPVPEVPASRDNLEGVGGNTPGSLHWFPAPNPDPEPGCKPYGLQIVSADRQSVRPGTFVAVTSDPDATSWRIPSDVVVDEDVEVTLSCEGGNAISNSFVDSVRIVDGPPTTGTAPVLGALSAKTVFAPTECFVSAESSATLFSAPVTATPGATLLLDAWIVPAGDPRSSDEQPRAADKLPVTLVDGALVFRVELQGKWTLFARLTDGASGASSPIQQVDFTNPPTRAGPTSGCSAAVPEEVGALALSLLVSARRRKGWSTVVATRRLSNASERS
jgi:hypothetical protein